MLAVEFIGLADERCGVVKQRGEEGSNPEVLGLSN